MSVMTAYARVWRAKEMPWMPPDWDEPVVYAVRAFADGKASETQQRTAWDWLMYLTAASEEFADLSFRPGEEGRRATDFAEGKRFVGQQVRKMLRPELTPKPKAEIATAKTRRAPARKPAARPRAKRGSR